LRERGEKMSVREPEEKEKRKKEESAASLHRKKIDVPRMKAQKAQKLPATLPVEKRGKKKERGDRNVRSPGHQKGRRPGS